MDESRNRNAADAAARAIAQAEGAHGEQINEQRTGQDHTGRKAVGVRRIYRADVRNEMRKMGMLSRGNRKPPAAPRVRTWGLNDAERAYLSKDQRDPTMRAPQRRAAHGRD